MMNRELAREKAKSIVRECEGLRLNAYVCPAGHLTNGYGRRITSQQPQVITNEIAERWLEEDLQSVEQSIGDDVINRLNTNQLASLLSFVFNVGSGAFRMSTMRTMILANQMAGIPSQLMRWTKHGMTTKGNKRLLVESRGLKARREAEAELWSCLREL